MERIRLMKPPDTTSAAVPAEQIDHQTDDQVDPKIDRREFLALCAAGALHTVLAACQSNTPSSGNVTPTATSTRRPSPTVQPSPVNADWAALAAQLQGTLVRPNSPQYATARQLFSPY